MLDQLAVALWDSTPFFAKQGLRRLARACHPCVLPIRKCTPPSPIGGHKYAPAERGRSRQHARCHTVLDLVLGEKGEGLIFLISLILGPRASLDHFAMRSPIRVQDITDDP